jgi:multidrug resistance efflux pump
LLDLQEKLENAKKERIRVYSNAEGWHYEQNTKSVKEATDALEDYEREQKLASDKKYWQDKIDYINNTSIPAINAEKQKWIDLVDEIETQQEREEIELKNGATIEETSI